MSLNTSRRASALTFFSIVDTEITALARALRQTSAGGGRIAPIEGTIAFVRHKLPARLIQPDVGHVPRENLRKRVEGHGGRVQSREESDKRSNAEHSAKKMNEWEENEKDKERMEEGHCVGDNTLVVRVWLFKPCRVFQQREMVMKRIPKPRFSWCGFCKQSNASDRNAVGLCCEGKATSQRLS